MAFLSPDGPPDCSCRNPPCNTPRHLKSTTGRRPGCRPQSSPIAALCMDGCERVASQTDEPH
eukprot:scaffold22886_cov242-Isochrysis_galbana.AAC.3